MLGKKKELSSRALIDVKYDGTRVLCKYDNGQITITQKNGDTLPERSQELWRRLQRFPAISFTVDCEMVNVRQSTSATVMNKSEPIKLVAFDLVVLEGVCMCAKPIQD